MINGTVKTARGGDVVIISRFENHSIRAVSCEYERYVLRINVDLPSDDMIFSLFTNRPKSFDNVIPLNGHTARIEGVFEKIVSEHSLQSTFSERLENMLVTELLIYINRILPYQLDEYSLKTVSLVSNIKSDLEANYYNDFKLDGLAKKYNVSVSTLTHTFKKIVGVSVFEYLLFCRMTAAKKHLSSSDMTVGEIVESCGFTDNSNFSRAFKAQNGISPTDFRKKYRR